MKKTIFIFSILVAGLFMTSCLGEVSNSYTDSSFVYIEMSDDGTMFGKTISPYSHTRLITHSNMIMMNPGSIKVMNYNWEESYGTTTMRLDGDTFHADNVNLSGEPADISNVTLRMTELPEIGDPNDFIEILPPIYADNKDFMGDKWIFQYAYKARKGENAVVEFYKRNDDEENGDKIIIDINITLVGTPDGTATEDRADAIALNMSPLRYEYEGTSQTETKRLEVQFKYLVNGQPVTLPAASFTVAK